MTQTNLPISLALLHFAETLAKRQPALFASEVTSLRHSGHNSRSEEAIVLRLTDQAVRVWGAAMLELRDRKSDADTLRALAVIADRESLEAASVALDALDSTIVSHARSCATSAAGSSGTPEFVGAHAAFAAIALANGYDEVRREGVFAGASALLSELQAELAVQPS